MKFLKKTILTLFIACMVQISFAGEGMWLPLLLKALNERHMQSLGMKMTAEDIYSVNKGSLKDAIVRFGGGCTGEIISGEGLLLTNHHCGRGQIQSHSTLEHNYLEDGFWAKSQEEELPNAGLTATFLDRMEDVTAAALRSVTDEMSQEERQKQIDENIEAIIATLKIEEYQSAEVKSFFKGNQYFLLISTTFKDVRMVGAPPSSIGSYGHDTDNWVWPRHGADFSLFRIYADKNNLPAEYSEDNVPYEPKYYLPISLDGVSEGDFTLIFGFPGRTNEYLPSYAVQQIVDVIDPAKIAVRDQSLAVIDEAMRADAEVKILYTSKQSRISNAWKKWQGEVLGLTKTKAVEKKMEFEGHFQRIVDKRPEWQQNYGHLIRDFKELYNELEPYAKANAYYSEATRVNVELLRIVPYFNRLVTVYEKDGVEAYENYKGRLQGFLKGFYSGYRPEIDQGVFAGVMNLYASSVDKEFLPTELTALSDEMNGDFTAIAAKIYGNTMLKDGAMVNSIFEKAPSDVVKALKNDPAFILSAGLVKAYEERVAPKYDELNGKIELRQQKYMKALMEVYPQKKFYPDANSTLRVSYGQVSGYEPKDAVKYHYSTYLDGVMQKYKPGDYEFDVPEKLRQLYNTKNYGQYGEKGKMPVCFIGTNHTTGGNSGSPVIDANGNLIGLNFDRAWEGTMSDISYDPSICRNIMVDIRYVLFIVDKFGGASHLIEELELVHPKRTMKKNTGRTSIKNPDK